MSVLKIAIWIIVGVAALLSTILGIVLESNLSSWFRRSVLRQKTGRPATKRPFLAWLLFWLSAITVILGTAIASSLPDAQETASPPVVTIENKDTQVSFLENIDTQTIRALNKKGDSLWIYKVAGEISDSQVYDIDRDGSNEVILGVRGIYGALTDDAGKLLILSWQKDILAEYNCYDPTNPSIYVEPSAVSPFYEVGDFTIADLFSNGKPYLVLVATNGQYFSSRILILEYQDKQLSLFSEYWHPGFPGNVIVEDLNQDGVKEIIFYASNNSFPDSEGHNPIGVMVLDSSKVKGQAPPYWGNADVGTELWYYLVLPETTIVGTLGVEDWNGDKRPDIKIGLSDSCFFYVDYSGEIIGHVRGSGCKDESELLRLDAKYRP